MKRGKLVFFLFILVILFMIIGKFILKREDIKRQGDLNVYKKSEISKVTILIEVDNKSLTLIDNKTHEVIKKYTIATGKTSSPTPLGTFRITTKEKWGEGFGSRWMGLDVPWGKYGIHGTNKPGSIGFNASGGCVRMRNSDIEDLFDSIEVGTTVAIINGYYGPFSYGFRNLRPGATGADVLEVQKRLKLNGNYTGALDGIYGEGMKRGLIDFLKRKGHPLTDEISKNIYNLLGIVLME